MQLNTRDCYQRNAQVVERWMVGYARRIHEADPSIEAGPCLGEAVEQGDGGELLAPAARLTGFVFVTLIESDRVSVGSGHASGLPRPWKAIRYGAAFDPRRRAWRRME